MKLNDPFETILRRIHTGGYVRDVPGFERDVLDSYGSEHRDLLTQLLKQHSDLTGMDQLEEVLGDFVKGI